MGYGFKFVILIIPLGHDWLLGMLLLYYSENTAVYIMLALRTYTRIDRGECDRSGQGNGNEEEDGVKRRRQ